MTEHGKDASQRAELRERIVVTATEAFTSKGMHTEGTGRQGQVFAADI